MRVLKVAAEMGVPSAERVEHFRLKALALRDAAYDAEDRDYGRDAYAERLYRLADRASDLFVIARHARARGTVERSQALSRVPTYIRS